MPSVTVFSGKIFWILVASVAFASWVLRTGWRGPDWGKKLLFVAGQVALLHWAIGLPLVTLAALGLAIVAFYYATGLEKTAFYWALALGGVIALLALRPAWASFRGPLAPGRYLLVGYSYLVLKAGSFFMDCRSGRAGARNLGSFAAYTLFAPAYVAGPIARYGPFAKGLESQAPLSAQDLKTAIERILYGLVKKLFVVGLLSRWDLTAMPSDSYALQPAWQLWRGLYTYAWVLYLDFSGYSDLAIGTGLLFGIKLPENFNWPYRRRNIVEFWNHWHASLTSWLRDYLFLPLGQRGFRVSFLRDRPLFWGGLCYLVTMLFCGFWHGSASHFLLWGLYHGLGLAGYKALKTTFDRRAPVRWQDAWYRTRTGEAAAVLCNFHFVLFGWLLFAFDTPSAALIVRRLLGGL